MAQKQYNSVIYFNLAGTGIVPGIVLTSRMEQIPGTQDTQEVLSVLYAHPEDEQHAIHKAKDIGDVKFTLKPASATNHFGWADTAEGAVPPEPETVEPVATEPSVPELPPVEGVATLPPISADHASEPPQQIDRDYPTWKEPKYQEDESDAVPATVEPAAESVTELEPEEVFADPEGRTIGVADGAGGYAHIRDNPFPPSEGQVDLTGHPIK